MISIETLIGATGFHHAEKWNHNEVINFLLLARSLFYGNSLAAVSFNPNTSKRCRYKFVHIRYLNRSTRYRSNATSQLKVPSLKFNRVSRSTKRILKRMRIQSRTQHRMTKKCSHLFVIPAHFGIWGSIVLQDPHTPKRRSAIWNVPCILFGVSSTPDEWWFLPLPVGGFRSGMALNCCWWLMVSRDTGRIGAGFPKCSNLWFHKQSKVHSMVNKRKLQLRTL